MVDANDHAGSGAARTDDRRTGRPQLPCMGRVEERVAIGHAAPRRFRWLITTEHHQSAFIALTTDARRGRTGVEMRRHVEIRRYLVSTTSASTTRRSAASMVSGS